MSCLRAELTIETANKIIKQEANSLLKNFFGVLCSQMKFDYIDNGVITTDGKTQNVRYDDHNFEIVGIRIGSGTTAVDICNDYNLEAELFDISYANLSIDFYCSSNEAGITIYQEATNNASESQSVNEVGLLGKAYAAGILQNCYYDRTVLVETVTLEPEQTMKITYKLKYVA